MYLKFVLKETLSVLKSFVLSIFYLAVEKGARGEGVSEKSLRTNVGGIRENVTVRYNGGWGGGGGKIAVFLRYVLFE